MVDAESSELVWAYETIRRSGPDAEELVFELWGNVLYFRDFDVREGYDAREVSRSMIDHVLRFHGTAAGAVFIFGVHDSALVRDAFTDCGFEVVRKTEDMEFLTRPRDAPPATDRQNERAPDTKAAGAGVTGVTVSALRSVSTKPKDQAQGAQPCRQSTRGAGVQLRCPR